MSRCVLVFTVLACFLLAGVEELRAEEKTRNCRNSGIVVDLLEQQGLAVSVDDVYKDFKAIAGTTCQLEETCCSHKLEDSLQDFTATQYSSKVRTAISDRLSSCRKAPLIDETAKYFQEFKSLIIMHLKNVYGNFFNGHEGILDELFGKLDLAIREGETQDINSIYLKTFFQIYTATFLAYPGQSGHLNTDAARNCFYQQYLNTQGSRVDHLLSLFRQSFNSLMFYLRGIHASEKLVEKLITHSMSQQCKISLVKMDRCSGCAGYLSLRSCNGLCMNLLRGCLVDLSDLEQPIMELSQALVEANERFSSMLDKITEFEQNVFNLIGDTHADNLRILTGLSSCDRSKRSIESDGEIRGKRQSHLVPRSQLEFPFETFNETSVCLRGKISSLLNIPEAICGASASRDNKDCWNGHLYDSYSRNVVEFRRVSQKDNPEVLYCPNPSQFQYEINVIRRIVRELASVSGKCSSDDEDCSNFPVPTNFYEFPPASEFKSTTVASVDDEETATDGGSGSGSGFVPMLVCEQSAPVDPVDPTDVSPDLKKATNEKVFGSPGVSGSTSHLWSSSLTLITVTLTMALAAALYL